LNTNKCRCNRFIRILLFPMTIIVSALACTGALTDMLVVGQPTFQCPTVTPVVQATAPVGSPTTIPIPTVTPIVIQSPHPFYLDDPIDVGGVVFRLSNVVTISSNTIIATWQLEVRNKRPTVYEFFPAGQMIVSALADGQSGEWGASEAAAHDAGIPFRYESYRLNPGTIQIVYMAAYLPTSTPQAFVYRLDPTSSSDTNVISWVNQANPYC